MSSLYLEKIKEFPFYPYQLECIKKVISLPHYGFFIDCGGGKTRMMLEAFRQLKNQNKNYTITIMSYLSVIYYVWEQEAKNWGYDFTFHIMHGKGLSLPLPKADIYLINPAALNRKTVLLPKTDMLLIDESTMFKNWTSKRFDVLKRCLPYYSKRNILSGTPTPKACVNLFSQIFILDGGKALGTSSTKFQDTYFHSTIYSPYVLKPFAHTKKEIIGKIKPICAYIENPYGKTKARYNTLKIMPEQSFYVDYKTFVKDNILQRKDGTILAPSEAVKRTKLRQIATGCCYAANHNKVIIHLKKIERLKEMLESLQGNSLLIAYNYNHEYESICAGLQKTVPCIRGGVPARDRANYINRWDNRKLSTLCIHPAAAAHGLNLQHGGHHILWYSLMYDLELYLQLNRRLIRPGQKHTVFVHQFVVASTIEEDVYRVLPVKEAAQKDILQRLV